MTISKYRSENIEQFMTRSYNDLVQKVNLLKSFDITKNIYTITENFPLNTDVIISHNLGKRIVAANLFYVTSQGFFQPNTSFLMKFLPKDGGFNNNSILVYNTNASLVGRHVLTLIGV